MNLFRMGSFTLNSSKKADWKIECDALTDDDIECIASLIEEITIPFSSVEGIPRGGLRLAKAMQKYVTDQEGVTTHLIVDDVLTTGATLQRAKLRYWNAYPNVLVVGAVIFARGACAPWVSALFHTASRLWEGTRKHYRKDRV